MSDDATTLGGSLDLGWSDLLPDGGPLVRIHVLGNVVEAQVLHGVLDAEGIPHGIDSYRDTAYDGLFQATRGWGAVLVREEDAARARALIVRALEEFLDDPEAGADSAAESDGDEEA